jgi:hypothetical protein
VSDIDYSQPTNAVAGSAEKVEILRRRLELKLPLHVPGDRQYEPPAAGEQVRYDRPEYTVRGH